MCGPDASGSECGLVAGCCENGNEPLESKKCGEYLYYLNDHQLLRKDSAP
jgi:hypothetical protein